MSTVKKGPPGTEGGETGYSSDKECINSTPYRLDCQVSAYILHLRRRIKRVLPLLCYILGERLTQQVYDHLRLKAL